MGKSLKECRFALGLECLRLREELGDKTLHRQEVLFIGSFLDGVLLNTKNSFPK